MTFYFHLSTLSLFLVPGLKLRTFVSRKAPPLFWVPHPQRPLCCFLETGSQKTTSCSSTLSPPALACGWDELCHHVISRLAGRLIEVIVLERSGQEPARCLSCLGHSIKPDDSTLVPSTHRVGGEK